MNKDLSWGILRMLRELHQKVRIFFDEFYFFSIMFYFYFIFALSSFSCYFWFLFLLTSFLRILFKMFLWTLFFICSSLRRNKEFHLKFLEFLPFPFFLSLPFLRFSFRLSVILSLAIPCVVLTVVILFLLFIGLVCPSRHCIQFYILLSFFYFLLISMEYSLSVFVIVQLCSQAVLFHWAFIRLFQYHFILFYFI